MSRTAIYSALVLRNRSSKLATSSQESNNEVTLLTAEEGIIKATLFGGPKSKLRSHTAPYNSGKAWIYHDPAKDYRKLSDFDVHSWRPGIRELYERTMTAGGVAQTVLSTHGGGGDWGTALKLASATLDTLENANEELCSRLLVHFLWRWAGFLGIQPPVECCSNCGMETKESPLWFNAAEGTMLCISCIKNSQLSTYNPQPLQLSPGSRRWLSAVETLEPALLHRYSTDIKSFAEIKTLVTSVMSGALGKQLASWDW